MRTKSPLSTRSMSQLSYWIAVVAAALLPITAGGAETHPLVKKVQQLEERELEYQNVVLNAAEAANDKPSDPQLKSKLRQAKLELYATQDELRSARKERDRRVSNLTLHQQTLLDEMSESVDGREVAYGTLGHLESRRRGDWTYSRHRIRRLVQYSWPVGDDVELWLAEVIGSDTWPPDSRVSEFRQYSDELRTLTSDKSRFDWEGIGRDFWLRFAANVIRSVRADDPAEVWRATLPRDPQLASLYLAAYLEVVRTRKPQVIDAELLLPLLPKDEEPPVYQWAKYNLILTVLDQSPTATRELREETERRFFEWLSRTQQSGAWMSEARTFAGPIPMLYASGLPERRTRIIRTMQEHHDPGTLATFASLVGIPKSVRWRWFLSEERDWTHTGTLKDLLKRLSADCTLPLWIDEPARKDETRTMLRGRMSRLDAFESVLENTPYGLHFLRPDFVWIGTPERKGETETFLRDAEVKASGIRQLAEETDTGYIDTAWKDCIDFMEELHHFSAFQMGSQASADHPPVNLEVNGLPASISLAEVARQAKLDYEVFEDLLVVAPAAMFDKFRQARDAHLRRMVTAERLRLDDNEIGRELHEESENGFIDTALVDAADFLEELHELRILVAPKARETPINFDIAGVSLATTLTLMLVEHDLTWDTNGQVIAIGDEESVAELLKAQNRQRR